MIERHNEKFKTTIAVNKNASDTPSTRQMTRHKQKTE